MRITLEPFTPTERSLRWRMAEAFFEQSGSSAWTSGAVPYRATSSYPAARQHALLVTRLFREREAEGALAGDEKLVMLEMGGGLGLFAENFCRALQHGCGADGRRLRSRLLYLFADLFPRTVQEALRRPAIASLAAEGVLLPALFDVREAGMIRDLEGRVLSTSFAPSVVVANYVCCVVPAAVIRKSGRGEGSRYFEQQVALHAEALDGQGSERLLDAFFANPTGSTLLRDVETERRWAEIDLRSRFPAGPHAAIVAACLDGFDEATLVYPQPFVDALVGFAASAKPGALVTISDYGSSERSDLAGDSERKPQQYGNSISHGVNFALFDVTARQLGWSVVRTRNPYRVLHAAALRFLPRMPASFREGFQRAFVRREPGEDLSDFRDTASTAFEARQYTLAIRYYRRAVRLDPYSAQLHFLLGEACLEGGDPDDAYRHLRRGHHMAPEQFEFDFLLGRACNALGRDREAIAWYEAALAREEHHVTLTNLAAIHLRLGELKPAYRYLQRAVALKPDYARAAGFLQDLKDQWARQLASDDPEPGPRG